MKNTVKHGGRLAVALLVTAVGLSACGGSSDRPSATPPPGASAPPPGAPAPAPAPDNSVPASAGASVDAYIAYLRGLPTSETSEPVTVGGFVAPVDDTAAATTL